MIPLSVGLDVTPAAIGMTGVARYTEMVWAQLLCREDVTVHAFAVGRGRRLGGAARQLRVPLRAVHAAWRLAGRPTAEGMAGEAIDVVHSIDLVPPPTRKPLVVTVHDLFAITHAALVAPRSRDLQLRQLAAASRADVVVTTCRTTADAIIAEIGVSVDRVVVAPLGVGRPGPPPGRQEAPVPYILAVGTVTPRKGFETLAAAVTSMADPPLVLVAGPDAFEADKVRRRVEALDSRSRVRFLGAVDSSSLERLYREATLVCHPSLAEGFGLVVLEAMSFGVPVVASDIPATREIAGDSAQLVTPQDASALAAALKALLEDPGARAKLGRRGAENATKYTWAATADALVGAYRLAASLA